MPTLLILYNTKTGNTELMAKAVEKGAKAVQGIEVAITYHARPQTLQTIDAIIVGVPTYNHNMSLDIQTLLEKTARENIALKGKPAAAFGSYGWSGEAPMQVLEILEQRFQAEIMGPPILAKDKPDAKALVECEKLGKKVAETLLQA